MEESIQGQAKDLNGGTIGRIEPNPNLNNIEAIASKAGIEVPPETPLHIYEMVTARDKNRPKDDRD